MSKVPVETNRKRVVDRLAAEGWTNHGGGEHDVFRHPAHGVAVVPRHRELSKGVARSIARIAGWL